MIRTLRAKLAARRRLPKPPGCHSVTKIVSPDLRLFGLVYWTENSRITLAHDQYRRWGVVCDSCRRDPGIASCLKGECRWSLSPEQVRAELEDLVPAPDVLTGVLWAQEYFAHAEASVLRALPTLEKTWDRLRREEREAKIDAAVAWSLRQR